MKKLILLLFFSVSTSAQVSLTFTENLQDTISFQEFSGLTQSFLGSPDDFVVLNDRIESSTKFSVSAILKYGRAKSATSVMTYIVDSKLDYDYKPGRYRFQVSDIILRDLQDNIATYEGFKAGLAAPENYESNHLNVFQSLKTQIEEHFEMLNNQYLNKLKDHKANKDW